jgi:drug/metabolite transporter (DMT)-like permease
VGLLIALLGVVAVISQGSWEKLAVLTFNMGDVLMLIACLFYSG